MTGRAEDAVVLAQHLAEIAALWVDDGRRIIGHAADVLVLRRRDRVDVFSYVVQPRFLPTRSTFSHLARHNGLW